MEEIGLSYGAQYVAYGEFLDDSPWGLERSGPEYNCRLRKSIGESAAQILNRSFDLSKDGKDFSCGSCQFQSPYIDFSDVPISIEGKAIDAEAHIYIGGTPGAHSGDNRNEHTVIYGVGFSKEKVPLGESKPYFEKFTRKVKSLVQELSRDYCATAECRPLVPFYIKGLGLEVPAESDVTFLFLKASDQKANLLREAIKTNPELKSILSDYYGIHGKADPLEIPLDKAKEFLKIPAFQQIIYEELHPLKVDSQSCIESLCGECILRASLHSDNGKPTLKRTYLFNYLGQDDIKDIVHGDALLEIVNFAKFEYLENSRFAILHIDKLCELV